MSTWYGVMFQVKEGIFKRKLTYKQFQAWNHMSTFILTWLDTKSGALREKVWWIFFRAYYVLYLNSILCLNPRHLMIYPCQEHVQNLLHVPQRPSDWVRGASSWRQSEWRGTASPSAALTWMSSLFDEMLFWGKIQLYIWRRGKTLLSIAVCVLPPLLESLSFPIPYPSPAQFSFYLPDVG